MSWVFKQPLKEVMSQWSGQDIWVQKTWVHTLFLLWGEFEEITFAVHEGWAKKKYSAPLLFCFDVLEMAWG